MAARAHYYNQAITHQNEVVNIVPYAEITLFDAGTLTPIDPAEIFVADTGATTKPNPFSADEHGNVDFYLDEARDIKLRMDGPSIDAIDIDNLRVDSPLGTVPLNPSGLGTFLRYRAPDAFIGAKGAVEMFIDNRRVLLAAERGMIWGPLDQWVGTTQTTPPFGVVEWADVTDGNNAPKAQFTSLLLQEVHDDPTEINIRKASTTGPGGVLSGLGASNPIGHILFWGYGSHGGWEKNSLIRAKTAEVIDDTHHGGFISIDTVPLATSIDPIPRVTVTPKGWVYLDDSLPSSDNSYWNSDYANNIEANLTVRGLSAPMIVVKSYKALANGDRGDIAVLFGANATGVTDANTGLLIRTSVDAVSPFKSQVDFSNNQGNSMTAALRIDNASKVHALQGLVLPVLTAVGDLPVSISSSGNIGRLAGGSNGQLLTMVSGAPAWGAAPTVKRARVRRTTTQALTSGVNTTLLWDAEDYDTDSIHSTVSNTDRLTAPTVTANSPAVAMLGIVFASNSTGFRAAAITKNGTEIGGVRFPAVNGAATVCCFAVPTQVSTGDVFLAKAVQNSGSDLNVENNESNMFFALHIQS